MAARRLRSNFAQLGQHDEQLLRLGLLAERYFAEDPNTCLLKLRQLGEVLAQQVAGRAGLLVSGEESQYDLLRRLQDRNVLPREVFEVFDAVRRAGNAASHALHGDHRSALATLKLGWQLGLWFHRTFADRSFRSGPFIPPASPSTPEPEGGEALRAELAALQQELERHQAAHQEASSLLAATEARLREATDERAFWEQMAVEVEAEKQALADRLAALQAAAEGAPTPALRQLVTAAGEAAEALELDEADTRRLIDAQLREAGWDVDSERLTHALGARPERRRFRAIAEWPTASGPADYVLFLGLTPVAVIEAKRRNVDVAGRLGQAERYARDVVLPPEAESPGGPWAVATGHRREQATYLLPFAFSANGRPYLRQLETRSGVWFRDLRRPQNLAHALDGWYTPDGLRELLRIDLDRAAEHLAGQSFDFAFGLRDYQRRAIEAVEGALREGERRMLIAMATGTGKTKTCIAMLYRLLAAQRFRRVLFLVDRSALGEQAANEFKDTEIRGLQSFADVFGLQGLDAIQPEPETKVHVATVQSMVRRVLQPREDSQRPPVDTYDLIVVDECHRGYLLDRELSETELTFRSFEDYVSKYRRVLEAFDAVKVGLTATPALHTTEIFGPPIFTYSYREAVIGGYLVDHEPPYQITTELSQEGIAWQAGEEVPTYNLDTQQLELFRTPDELRFEVESFNRKVITESFNRVVCEFLVREIDPWSRAKTLIFCVNDAHADLVVQLLKAAFAARYPEFEDGAVAKITGNADRPQERIRSYRNERLPNVAVTVDLLTTGIDVPAISNLVFLRRVNSRILFEQMLGRATRRCDAIGKTVFRIFDAVRAYEALAGVTEIHSVAVNPNEPFAQLLRELVAQASHRESATLVRDQLLAKLQRQKRRFAPETHQAVETLTGLDVEGLIRHLKTAPFGELGAWLASLPGLGDLLDRPGQGEGRKVVVSHHPDQLLGVARGYGGHERPEDLLESFRQYLATHRNEIPALLTVLTRPRELTRRQLREVMLALDQAGFKESDLDRAWQDATNQEIAARIVGHIRQAAIGDPLVPYDQRVDRALQRILASRPWTTPQREWLGKIAKQTKANLLVDREAMDDPDLVFRHDGGGFARLNQLFDGQLEQALGDFNEAIWSPAA